MADEATTHAVPTGGIGGASILEDGSQVLLTFLGSPVGVTVPRETLVNLVALGIDASAERLSEAGNTSAVRAIRMGRFTLGAAAGGGRVVLGVETEANAGSVSFDLPVETAREMATLLADLLRTL